MTKRFIQANDLPKTLWCEQKNIMHLPPLLVEGWKKLLSDNDLDKMAQTKGDDSFVGGISKEDTDKYLAWRYNGSCGRVILSLLGPDKKLDIVSDAYASTFSGNRVFLADLPCGSGAATVSILTTLIELRKQGVIPRLPLTIVIVAGEISECARSYFNSQIDELMPLLKEQAVWIEYETIHWDALDPMSTADLIKKLTLNSQKCTARLLILSNFSGFLENEGKWKAAKMQFDNIFLHSRDELSTAIWIEPQKNNVANFMTKILKWFHKLFNTESDNEAENVFAKANMNFQQPIKSGLFPVRLTVMRFDLPLSKPE